MMCDRGMKSERWHDLWDVTKSDRWDDVWVVKSESWHDVWEVTKSDRRHEVWEWWRERCTMMSPDINLLWNCKKINQDKSEKITWFHSAIDNFLSLSMFMREGSLTTAVLLWHPALWSLRGTGLITPGMVAGWLSSGNSLCEHVFRPELCFSKPVLECQQDFGDAIFRKVDQFGICSDCMKLQAGILKLQR